MEVLKVYISKYDQKETSKFLKYTGTDRENSERGRGDAQHFTTIKIPNYLLRILRNSKEKWGQPPRTPPPPPPKSSLRGWHKEKEGKGKSPKGKMEGSPSFFP